MKKPSEKKEKSALGIWVAIMVVTWLISSELSGDTAAILLAVLFLLLPAALAVGVFILVKKKRQSVETTHSHDRIDHRKDLTINPETGRTESRPLRHQAHSPREHWKQQLDGLLENGTIDKAEYKAMLNRKF